MKLADLNPRWVGAGGEGISHLNESGESVPVPRRTGVGVGFDCPCGCADRCFVHFANPLDGGPDYAGGAPTWQRTGEDFETLTLTPSIQRVVVNGKGCGWHGFVTNGEVTGC